MVLGTYVVDESHTAVFRGNMQLCISNDGLSITAIIKPAPLPEHFISIPGFTQKLINRARYLVAQHVFSPATFTYLVGEYDTNGPCVVVTIDYQKARIPEGTNFNDLLPKE